MVIRNFTLKERDYRKFVNPIIKKIAITNLIEKSTASKFSL